MGSGRNILIKGCSFNNTVGTNPQAGVDIEAHGPGVVFDNIRFEECEIAENAVGGFVIAYGLLDETSEESFVTVKNTVIRNNRADAAIQVPAKYKAGGHIVLENVTFSSSETSMYSLQVVASQVHVELNNVNFLTQRADGTGLPILAEQRDYSTQGSVTLNNVQVNNNNQASNILYWSDRYDVLNQPLTGKKAQPSNYFGDIHVTSTNGTKWNFNANEIFNPLLIQLPAVNYAKLTTSVNHLTPGNSFRFKGQVVGNNAISQRMYWSVKDATSSATNIDTRGYLTIAPDESAQTIRVIGTPASDPTKAIQQVVFVNQAPSAPSISSGSDGGSSGTGGSGGGSRSYDNASKTKSSSTSEKPFTLAIGTTLINKALAEKSPNAKILSFRAINYTSVEPAVLTSLQKLANNAGVELIIHFDQVKDKIVQTRISINTKTAISSKISLMNISETSKSVKTKFAKLFDNPIEVYTLPIDTSLVIKLPSEIAKESLTLYAYDSKANSYTLIKNHTIDEKGYIHFKPSTGTTILSNGAFTKR